MLGKRLGWIPTSVAAASVAAGVAAVAGRSCRREASLRGQGAVVTGGSRGLGFLLARALGREGCRVAICARNEEELERARAQLSAGGIEAIAVACDVSDRAQVQRLVETVRSQLGPVDILVNNAGIIQVGPLESMTIEDFEHSLGVMFWGTLHPTLAVLDEMRARGRGRIVNITSLGGKISVPHLLPYNCGKFAAIGFSEGLRAELSGSGVTVTTVVPGPMRTGSYVQAMFKGNHAREMLWFALSASLPFISMDAERATRQIVRAIRRGDPEVILSISANLAARVQGLFPGTMADCLGLVNRVLLPSGRDATLRQGKAVEPEIRSPVLDALTSWGRSAASQYHEVSGNGK